MSHDAVRYLKLVRTGIILVVGLTVVAAGLVMLFTPGPAIVVVPAGLAILATEFAWARRLLDRGKAAIARRAPGSKPPPSA